MKNVVMEEELDSNFVTMETLLILLNVTINAMLLLEDILVREEMLILLQLAQLFVETDLKHQMRAVMIST